VGHQQQTPHILPMPFSLVSPFNIVYLEILQGVTWLTWGKGKSGRRWCKGGSECNSSNCADYSCLSIPQVSIWCRHCRWSNQRGLPGLK